MSWARKKKSKPKVAQEDKPKRDISEMHWIRCAVCNCSLRYSTKKPNEPQYCEACKEKREKHKIPW